MNAEARKAFLDFADSDRATWAANFRDLAAAVTRMATLADSGRIALAECRTEIRRLEQQWQSGKAAIPLAVNGELDLFDAVQLDKVLEVCRCSDSLSEAGRMLFQTSRQKRKQANDADRLRKYLAKFGLAWKDIAKS